MLTLWHVDVEMVDRALIRSGAGLGPAEGVSRHAGRGSGLECAQLWYWGVAADELYWDVWTDAAAGCVRFVWCRDMEFAAVEHDGRVSALKIRLCLELASRDVRM